MKSMAVCLAILAALMSSDAVRGDWQGDDKTAALADGANRFALDLYKRAGSADQNLIFSPYSIDTALLMTYAGAHGDTAAEMARVLHLPAGLAPADLHQAAGKLIARFQTARDHASGTLRVANALWAQQGVQWLPPFLDLLDKNYQAKLATLNFADAEQARKTINDWVAQQTADKIQQLISSGVLNADTRLVLTNAVYFKADWQDPFEKFMTADGDFHVGGKPETVKTSMMHRTGGVLFMQDDQLQAIEMPYAGDDLAMLVLLPRSVDGLAAVESKLDEPMLGHVVAGLSSTQVAMALPKYKIAQRLALGSVLRTLGMDKAFDPREADFSAMDGNRDLVISDVLHQAYVAVDEQGTEAAAATGMVMGATAIMASPTAFDADHPFVFLIRDTKTGVILFVGRVQDPRQP
ncbi:MAG: serpin family protein [Tepidisphaeraceae bacterium]